MLQPLRLKFKGSPESAKVRRKSKMASLVCWIWDGLAPVVSSLSSAIPCAFMSSGSRLDTRASDPAKRKTAVRSRLTATRAKMRGPAIAAALPEAVSVEVANISSFLGMMIGTSADLAGPESMCVPAVIAMPI